MTRVQVILEEEERERFRYQAAREGQSLSAWLRAAGRERLDKRGRVSVQTIKALRAFFRGCTEREQGREPDWEEHKAVIAQSTGEGTSGT